MVELLASKTEDLGFISGPPMVEGENYSDKLSPDTHIHIISKIVREILKMGDYKYINIS